MLDRLPARGAEAEARDDLVGPPPERFEHPLGLLRSGRLSVDPALQVDGGVDSEHGPLVRFADRARLAGGVITHEGDGVGVGRVVLLVVGLCKLERDPQLLEDRAALRRRRGEQERRRRRDAHERLRVTQICSEGQRRAQSRSGRPG